MEIKDIKVLLQSRGGDGLRNGKDSLLNEPTENDLGVCLVVFLANGSNSRIVERDSHVGVVLQFSSKVGVGGQRDIVFHTELVDGWLLHVRVHFDLEIVC